MSLLKKTFQFSWIGLVATVMLLSSCDNAQQSHDLEFDRVHNIMRYSDSIPRTVDSLMALGEINQMCADFYNMSYNMSRDVNRSCMIADSALARPVVTERDRIYHFLIAANNSELDYASRHYESGLRRAQQLVNSVDTSFINRHYLLQTGYLLAYNNLALCYILLERSAEGEKYMQHVMSLINQFEKTSENDSVAQHNWEVKRTQFAVSAMISYCNMHQWDGAEAWMNRAEKYLQNMADNPRVDKVYYPLFCYQVSCVKAYILEKAGHHQEAAQAYDDFMKNPLSKSVVARINSVSYLNSSHRYEEAERNINDVETVMGQLGMKMDLETLNGIVKLKFDAHLGAGHRDSALAVATRILDRLDSAEVWQRRDKTAELATIYDTQGKEMEIAKQQAEMSRQRLMATGLSMLMLLTFFIVYTLYKRKASHRLAAAHNELKKAYDQLEEATAHRERIESELRIARDIQMSMVPNVSPDREGLDLYASMTPAKEVGGDLYGYLLIGDSLYFCVGDVSGKGVPASLFMAQATRLFRTLAAQSMMPAEIATRMNNALTEGNEQGMFVTMFLGLVDLQSGRLDFCNAGHNPPIIYDDQQHGAFLEMEPNAPIGLWPELEFVGESIENVKGRPFFVYTDGLNEAENTSQEQYGDERLLAFLRAARFHNARKLLEALKADVERFRDGAEPNDDMTMLCLRVE